MQGTFITGEPHPCRHHADGREHRVGRAFIWKSGRFRCKPQLCHLLSEISAGPYPSLGSGFLLRTLMCAGD